MQLGSYLNVVDERKEEVIQYMKVPKFSLLGGW